MKTRSLNFGLSAAILLCGSVIANAAGFNISDSDVTAQKAAMMTANTNHEADTRAMADHLGSSNNDYDLHLLDSFSMTPQAEPPSITAQPQSQTVTAPATATFSVTATGTEPLLYQWNKNGAVISGATSSTYTTPATTTGANGASFTVTVMNSFGSITSTGNSIPRQMQFAAKLLDEILETHLLNFFRAHTLDYLCVVRGGSTADGTSLAFPIDGF